jgi:outer membrane protein assembly factor BamB
MKAMKSYPTLRRWLSAVISIAVFAGVIAVVAWPGSSPQTANRAQADDSQSSMARAWPMFGGSLSRNMVNTVDKNMPTEWSVEPGKMKNIKWSAKLGSRSYSGPSVAGGQVYVGTNRAAPRTPAVPGDKGVLRCYRESDGKFLWQSINDKLPAGLVNDWPDQGICSTAAVEGNHIYFVSNRCELVCATTAGLQAGNEGVKDEKYNTPTDADIVWHLDMIKELNVFPHNLATSSPLIVGDLVFVITSNGVDEGHINIPSPKAPSFIAVDKKTGKVKWQDNSPGEKIIHGQWSNPVYAVINGQPQVIFPGGDGWVRGFEPQTGTLLWKFDCNPKKAVYRLGGKGDRSEIIATPVVYDNKLYIGVGQDPEHRYGVGHYWCIDIAKKPNNPDKDLTPVNDNFDPKAPVNKDSGLVWHFGGPADKKTAEEIGREYVFGRTMSTAAIHDDLLYIAELEGWLHCFDAKTGKKYWDHNLKADIWGSAYWVDGKIYIGTDDGEMYIFKHGKDKDLIDTIDMKARVRGTPVAVNGVLFVMTENTLYAIKKP